MILTSPDSISFQSLSFLKKAIEKNPLPDDPEIWDILEDARNGKGEIYTWNKGAMYLEIYPEIVNVMLMGGEDISEWRDEVVSFLKNLMKERGIKNLSILGRGAWHKIAPDLKLIGTFYTYQGGV